MTIPDGRVVGNDKQNPFEQVRGYQSKWINFLKRRQNKFLSPAKAQSMSFDHVSAFVVISPSLHPDSETQLPYLRWFRLISLDELSKAVSQEVSRSLNFSKQELRTLVTNVLRLKPSNIITIGIPQEPQRVNLYNHFKESTYSPDHHSKDIRAIKQIIETNNSLLILGVSGSGKSSILRFLVSNPAAQSEGTISIYIDCNGLDWDGGREATYEEICHQIVEHLDSQNVKSETLWQDKGSAKRALEFLMRNMSRDKPNHLAIIFDRSELLQSKLGHSFFNYLRSLRDINPRLSYIFSGRDLNPLVFGELTDILWNEPHWIGALSLDDAKMAINRHLTRLKISLEAKEKDSLLRCIGRHPALLKYACELVQAEKMNLNETEAKVTEQLLATPLIERQCRDIWQDLDFTIQDALRRVARVEIPPVAEVEWLTRCGLLDYSENGELGFTSPLFKEYVRKLGPSPLIVKQGIVFKGSEELNLSKEEFNLFKLLWDNQPQIVSHDQISDMVWSDVHGGVSPQMITNLVMRLRDKLGDSSYIDSVHGRGYRFLQGTAPLPRNSNARTSMLQK